MPELSVLFLIFFVIFYIANLYMKKQVKAARRDSAEAAGLDVVGPGDDVLFDPLGKTNKVARTYRFEVGDKSWLLAYFTGGADQRPNAVTFHARGAMVWAELVEFADYLTDRGGEIIIDGIYYKFHEISETSYTGFDYNLKPLSGNVICTLYASTNDTWLMMLSNDDGAWTSYLGRPVDLTSVSITRLRK